MVATMNSRISSASPASRAVERNEGVSITVFMPYNYGISVLVSRGKFEIYYHYNSIAYQRDPPTVPPKIFRGRFKFLAADLAGVEGLEPPTPGFGDRCSSH